MCNINRGDCNFCGNLKFCYMLEHPLKWEFHAAGKNAYAMSVLRRVEMKIDGQDITDNRYLLPL